MGLQKSENQRMKVKEKVDVIKVTIQWLLYCMVHNIEKIANFGPPFAVE